MADLAQTGPLVVLVALIQILVSWAVMAVGVVVGDLGQLEALEVRGLISMRPTGQAAVVVVGGGPILVRLVDCMAVVAVVVVGVEVLAEMAQTESS
jgi:hypothetical protein